jgi:hypothetical protein
MQIELAIVEALISANVAPDKAKAAAEAVYKEIDKRYELHSKQLATRGDVEAVSTKIENLRADMFKTANEQTWKLAALVLSANALLLAGLKLMGN